MSQHPLYAQVLGVMCWGATSQPLVYISLPLLKSALWWGQHLSPCIIAPHMCLHKERIRYESENITPAILDELFIIFF